MELNTAFPIFQPFNIKETERDVKAIFRDLKAHIDDAGSTELHGERRKLKRKLISELIETERKINLYKKQKFPSSAQMVVSSLFNNEANHDLTFIVEGKMFYAHKFIMKAASKYFFKICTPSGFAESELSEISLPELSANHFEQILSYIYKNEIALTETNCIDLFFAADRFFLTDLKKECELVLSKFKWYNGALFLLELFRKGLQIEPFFKVLLEKARKNANIVMLSPEFLLWPKELLVKFIDHGNTCASFAYHNHAIDLFNAIMRWVNYNQPPQEDIEAIFSDFPFDRIPVKNLLTEVSEANIFSEKKLLDLSKQAVNKGDVYIHADCNSIRLSKGLRYHKLNDTLHSFAWTSSEIFFGESCALPIETPNITLNYSSAPELFIHIETLSQPFKIYVYAVKKDHTAHTFFASIDKPQKLTIPLPTIDVNTTVPASIQDRSTDFVYIAGLLDFSPEE